MSTFNDVTKTCILCFKESEQVEINSTSSFGYDDLDFRPPMMARSTIFAWLEACPHCGYVAKDIFDLSCIQAVKHVDVMRKIVSSESYKKCDNINFCSDYASNFYRHHLILLKSDNTEEAFLALRNAAWVCDDMGDEENAIICRKKAIELIDRITSESFGKFDINRCPSRIIKFLYNKYTKIKKLPDAEYLDLVRLDMLRRIGDFERVINEYSKKCYSKKIFNKVLKLQTEKAMAKDDSTYTLEDV